MDINELFKKSLGISLNVKFKIKYIKNNKPQELFETIELTYMELGLFLINNSSNIERIDIILKEEKDMIKID